MLLLLPTAVFAAIASVAKGGRTAPAEEGIHTMLRARDPNWDGRSLQATDEFRADYVSDDDPTLMDAQRKVEKAKLELKAEQKELADARQTIADKEKSLSARQEREKEAAADAMDAADEQKENEAVAKESQKAADKENTDLRDALAKAAQEKKALRAAEADMAEAARAVANAVVVVQARKEEHMLARTNATSSHKSLEEAQADVAAAEVALRKAKGDLHQKSSATVPASALVLLALRTFLEL